MKVVIIGAGAAGASCAARLRRLREDIEILISRCNQVLSNHLLAPKLLPIVDEFPFESNPYNDSYFEEIGNVKEYLLKVLLPEFNNLDSNENIYLEIRD